MQALVLISVSHQRGYFRPSFGVSLIELQKLVILFGAPGFDLAFGDLLVFLLDFHVEMLSIFGEQVNDKLLLHSSIVII